MESLPPPYLDLDHARLGQPDLARLEQPDLARLGQPDLARLEHPDLARLGSVHPEAERVYEIVPAPRRAGVRVVGPGKRERAYLERLSSLETDLAAREKALANAALIERGTSRLLDRLESDVAEGRERARAIEGREKRLILALGALQRENEMLREKVARLAAGARPRALAGPRARRPGLWSRLFGGA